MQRFVLILCLIAGVFNTPVLGQLSFDGTAPLTIDFTGFTGSGFAPAPAAGQLDSDDWRVTGFSDGSTTFGGTHILANDFARGNTAGGETTGGVYSLNNAALWVQPGGSDFTPGEITLRIVNNTGTVIPDIAISYDILYLNDGTIDRDNSFNLAYSTDDIAYTPVPALNFTTPGALDALGIQTVGRSTVLTGVNLAIGGIIYLQWQSDDVSGGGSRDELGLDNIVFGIPPSIDLATAGPVAGTVYASATDQLVLSITADVAVAEAELTGATFTTAGTYVIGDLDGFNLYYSTDANFDLGTDILLGSVASVASGGSITFSGLSQTIPISASNYLFLTADVNPGASAGHTLTINAPTLSDFTVAVPANVTDGGLAAGGTQTIASPVVEPSSNPASIGAVNNLASPATAQDITFPAAGTKPSGYLVVQRVGTAAEAPSDGTDYNVGDAVGTASVVVFKGPDAVTAFTVGGLSPSTTYHYAVYAYNGGGASINFRTAGAPTVSATTDDGETSDRDLTVITAPYVQDFNSMITAGTDVVIGTTGWVYAENPGDGNLVADDGSTNAGSVYSYGSGVAADRALGAQADGGAAPIIGAEFTNSTGIEIRQLAIAYVLEQWRRGDNAANTLTFEYSLDATSLTDGTATWVAVPALDGVSPTTTGSSIALDGNNSANQDNVAHVIYGLSIPDGSTFWIRWLDADDVGADDGLAIDDFRLRPYNVIQWYGSSAGGDVALASNWTLNSDGNTTTPLSPTPTLTEDFSAYYLRAAATYSVNSNVDLTNGGANTNTNLTIGDGVSAVNVTVADNSTDGVATLIGNVDINASGTLTLNDDLSPTFGTLNTASTVAYTRNGAQSVAAATYGNLTFNTTAVSTKTFLGNVTVDGTLTVSNANVRLSLGNHSLTLNGGYTGFASDAGRNIFQTTANSTIVVAGTGGDITIPPILTPLGTLTLTRPSVLTIALRAVASTASLTVDNLNITNAAAELTQAENFAFFSNLIQVNTDLTVDGTLTIFPNNGLTLNGTATFNPGSTLVMDNTTTLTIGGAVAQFSLPTSVTDLLNLTVNRPNGVLLSANLTLANTGILTLTDGALDLGTNTLAITNPAVGAISGGSASTYVTNGTLQRTTNSTNPYVFPVGSAAKYREVTLTPTAAVGSTYEVEFRDENTTTAGYKTGPGFVTLPLQSVSDFEYYLIDRPAGTDDVTITLNYDAGTYSGGAIGTDINNLRVAHFTGGSWVNAGGTALGDLVSGTVTSGVVSSFSPFAVGSLEPSDVSTLPVELLSFSGERVGADVQLYWNTASELNNDRYEIQRSATPSFESFDMVGTVAGQGTTNEITEYSFLDREVATAQVWYYRLRQVDYDGTATLTDAIEIAATEQGAPSLTWSLKPNPSTGSDVDLLALGQNVEANASVAIQVIAADGRVVLQARGAYAQVRAQLLEVLRAQPAGTYVVSILYAGFEQHIRHIRY